MLQAFFNLYYSIKNTPASKQFFIFCKELNPFFINAKNIWNLSCLYHKIIWNAYPSGLKEEIFSTIYGLKASWQTTTQKVQVIKYCAIRVGNLRWITNLCKNLPFIVLYLEKKFTELFFALENFAHFKKNFTQQLGCI